MSRGWGKAAAAVLAALGSLLVPAGMAGATFAGSASATGTAVFAPGLSDSPLPQSVTLRFRSKIEMYRGAQLSVADLECVFSGGSLQPETVAGGVGLIGGGCTSVGGWPTRVTCWGNYVRGAAALTTTSACNVEGATPARVVRQVGTFVVTNTTSGALFGHVVYGSSEASAGMVSGKGGFRVNPSGKYHGWHATTTWLGATEVGGSAGVLGGCTYDATTPWPLVEEWSGGTGRVLVSCASGPTGPPGISKVCHSRYSRDYASIHIDGTCVFSTPEGSSQLWEDQQLFITMVDPAGALAGSFAVVGVHSTWMA